MFQLKTNIKGLIHFSIFRLDKTMALHMRGSQMFVRYGKSQRISKTAFA